MEEGTLAFAIKACLANKAWFSALGIDTNHEARVSIDALGAVFDRFNHFYYLI
jgi:hypothetical protein